MAHVNPVQIQKFLKGVDYPARKQTLLDTARREGADEQVCASLEQLPDKEFETPASVSKAFGDLPDAPEGGTSGPVQADAGFVAQVAQDAMAEMQRGQVALTNSASENVRQCAQTLIDDHGELGSQFERYARLHKIDLARDVRPDQANALKKLSKLKGEEFDRAYLDQTHEDHTRNIKIFAHNAATASDEGLRKLARQGEQMLKKHEKLISGLGGKH